MKEYSTKTCNIEALQWTGDNYKEMEDFIGLGFPGMHYSGGNNPSLITSNRIYAIKKTDYAIKYIDDSLSIMDEYAFNEIFKED